MKAGDEERDPMSVTASAGFDSREILAPMASEDMAETNRERDRLQDRRFSMIFDGLTRGGHEK
jgi:hypothetical protein